MSVGKTSTDYIATGVSMYVKRLTHYVPFELKVIPDVKLPRNADTERQKQIEGESMLREISPSDRVVLLDERGLEMTSREFATYLDKKMVSLQGRLIFIIGGPYGFSKEMYGRADEKLSLSKMTFSHEMIRLFFTEQIYRAMTILRGEPYHHD